MVAMRSYHFCDLHEGPSTSRATRSSSLQTFANFQVATSKHMRPHFLFLPPVLLKDVLNQEARKSGGALALGFFRSNRFGRLVSVPALVFGRGLAAVPAFFLDETKLVPPIQFTKPRPGAGRAPQAASRITAGSHRDFDSSSRAS